MTIRYLNAAEFAEYIGVKRNTVSRYKLPPVDAYIGKDRHGWLPESIDAWQARRPGPGNRDNGYWEIPPVEHEPIRYLNRTEFAELLGIRRGSLWSLKLPPPDAQLGKDRPGWLPKTIKEWQARRPGPGNWKNANWNLPAEHR